jgi:universal stress protein A
MRIKPAKGGGTVLVEVGPKDEALLAKEAGEKRVFRLQKILVPVDFSEGSSKALQYAVSFARVFRAELLCLYVVEIPYGAGEAGFVTEMESFRKDMSKESQERMDMLLAREAAGVPSQSKVRSGAPYHEITAAARDENVDLIIIATHGRTGLRRLFLGSTAERVVRHAHCPVLVVREHEHEFIASTESTPARGARPGKAA